MSDDKTDKATEKKDQQQAQASGQNSQAGQAQVVTESTAAATETPDTGRPVPPDAALGQPIHQPGRAPGMNILSGPAEMTVGAHRKSKK